MIKYKPGLTPERSLYNGSITDDLKAISKYSFSFALFWISPFSFESFSFFASVEFVSIFLFLKRGVLIKTTNKMMTLELISTLRNTKTKGSGIKSQFESLAVLSKCNYRCLIKKYNYYYIQLPSCEYTFLLQITIASKIKTVLDIMERNEILFLIELYAKILLPDLLFS